MKPRSGGTFPAALELCLQVLPPMVVAQCVPNVREDLALITSRLVEILEQDGIWRNPELAFVHYAEAAKHNDGIWVHVN
jgi:hypothetical protein